MATPRQTGLVKGLGLIDSTTLVMGSMIGSGVFIVAADISRQVQSPGLLIVTWIVTALLTLIAALSYGELAAAMPHAGGQYVYLREAFGPMYGFLYGWTLFMVIQTGTIAAVAVAFAKYAGVFVPWVSAQNYLVGSGKVGVTTQQLLAILLICFLTWVNTRGLRTGATVQNVFTDRQGRGAARTDRLRLPGGTQSRGRGQQLHRFLAQRELERRNGAAGGRRDGRRRCSRRTPGIT